MSEKLYTGGQKKCRTFWIHYSRWCYITINIYLGGLFFFFFPPMISQVQELHGITYEVCVHSAAGKEAVLWFLHVVFKLVLFLYSVCKLFYFKSHEVPPSILSQMLMAFYKKKKSQPPPCPPKKTQPKNPKQDWKIRSDLLKDDF